MSAHPYTLSSMKPLTSAARDDARHRALRRVTKLAGERPARRRFAVEAAPLWGVLDFLALAVFLSALVISSLNIISHMGRLASAGYVASPAGIAISRGTAVVLMQVFSIPLAEFSMVAFLVMVGLSRGWRRAVYLALATLATAFLLVANIESGIGSFEAALPALFTIGTGLRLEYLLTEQLRRREEVDARYRDALAQWERATHDPAQHPAYWALLREELWGKLINYKSNEAFVNAPPDFKRAAVQRELDAMQWAGSSFFPTANDAATRANGLPASSVKSDSARGLLPDDSVRIPVGNNGTTRSEKA